ncbi:CRISPR-associated endoribonuclease Cas6 [Thermococcus sp.]|uniref:CRISPR-associated endoribonuclease Cas6 n=1 Tax=Thermococcus sp. TaxID=35749 RepID=UPI00261ECD17|nr:CRISPR-associated endoribonuclease Cas6 [Thermococcus sp.]
MRLKVAFYPENGTFERPNKHAVQGFIYSLLKGSEYGERHDEPRFKFFTFSDFFMDSMGRPTLLISSPEKGFINTLYGAIKDNFKLHQHRDLRFFLQRLKENAEKKYEAFYGEDFFLEGPIFDRLIPKLRNNGKLDVYVKVVKNGVPFPVIGSNWELLEKERIRPEERRFYRFIMDAGLGEKNSLGFGFLNPIRR